MKPRNKRFTWGKDKKEGGTLPELAHAAERHWQEDSSHSQYITPGVSLHLY